MRFIAVNAFVLSLAAVAGAAVVAARDGAEVERAPGGAAAAAVTGPGTDAVGDARTTARIIAKEVSRRVTPEMGDALVRLVERGTPRGAAYRVWRDFLEQERERHGVTSVYVMVRIDRETVGVVIEAVEDGDAPDGWLAAYEIEPAMRKAFDGRAAASREPPFFDPRIRGGAPHVRALAPVRDGDGEVVAILGVDLEVGDRRVAR